MPNMEQYLKRHRPYWMIVGLMALISIILLSSTYGQHGSTSYAKLSTGNDIPTIAVGSLNDHAFAIKQSAGNFIHLTGSTSRVLVWLLFAGFIVLMLESVRLRSQLRLFASVVVPIIVMALLGRGIDGWLYAPDLSRAVPVFGAIGLLVGLMLISAMERGWKFLGPVKSRIPNAPPTDTTVHSHPSGVADV
jgi:hypothetical protein